LFSEACFEGESREAAGAVAAHFSRRAVGVEVRHVKMVAVGEGLVEGENAVGADPKLSRTVLCGDVGQFFQVEVEEPVVDYDEVVSGTVHFGKFENKAPAHR
jgi:hypothetical protein